MWFYRSPYLWKKALFLASPDGAIREVPDELPARISTGLVPIQEVYPDIDIYEKMENLRRTNKSYRQQVDQLSGELEKANKQINWLSGERQKYRGALARVGGLAGRVGGATIGALGGAGLGAGLGYMFAPSGGWFSRPSATPYVLGGALLGGLAGGFAGYKWLGSPLAKRLYRYGLSQARSKKN